MRIFIFINSDINDVKPYITLLLSDVFGMLSDEIILMIMQWLPRQSLCDCALVCQRWRRIAYDESLWQRIDLTCCTLRSDHMAHVLQRNPVILRMAQAEVADSVSLTKAVLHVCYLCTISQNTKQALQCACFHIAVYVILALDNPNLIKKKLMSNLQFLNP
jgi:hypothetical protein